MNDELISGLLTTVDAILPRKIENNQLPDTFTFDNIRNLFKNNWTTAFGRPLPLIQPEDKTLLIANQHELKELFDFDHPTSTAFGFKPDIELAFRCEPSQGKSEDDAILSCYGYVIHNPLLWWNNKIRCGLLINCNTAQNTMDSSSMLTSKQASQTMQYNVIDEITAKIVNLRPDLSVKDTYCRILFKGKFIPFQYHFISEFFL